MVCSVGKLYPESKVGKKEFAAALSGTKRLFRNGYTYMQKLLCHCCRFKYLKTSLETNSKVCFCITIWCKTSWHFLKSAIDYRPSLGVSTNDTAKIGIIAPSKFYACPQPKNWRSEMPSDFGGTNFGHEFGSTHVPITIFVVLFVVFTTRGNASFENTYGIELLQFLFVQGYISSSKYICTNECHFVGNWTERDSYVAEFEISRMKSSIQLSKQRRISLVWR